MRRVSAHLLNVCGPRLLITLFNSSICMQVDKVDIDTLFESDPHERETFWCQAVVFRSIGALTPLGTAKVDPVVVGEGVETRTEWYTTGCGGPVGMSVVLIKSSMVVEVLKRRRC